MKKKVGTVLDDKVLTAAKVLAAHEGKPLAELIEEALLEYMRRKRAQGAVARTAAGLPAPAKIVRAILQEEEDVFAS